MTIVDIYNQLAGRYLRLSVFALFLSVFYLFLISQKVDLIYSISMILSTAFMFISILYQMQAESSFRVSKKNRIRCRAKGQQLVAIKWKNHCVNFYNTNGQRVYHSKAVFLNQKELHFLLYNENNLLLHGKLVDGEINLSHSHEMGGKRIDICLENEQIIFKKQKIALAHLMKDFMPTSLQVLFDPSSHVLAFHIKTPEWEKRMILLLTHFIIKNQIKLKNYD
ncbi:hypothetical protein [Bacillus sp. 2205SS5-2]|uniref:hypothetical protein n=1 Tax=Bacillus sp. 2205SS5-2 TaxID=3109031 RepID=UPI003003B384